MVFLCTYHAACQCSAKIKPTANKLIKMSSAVHSNVYLLHFCSRGRETSRRCPSPQRSPHWWGQTQSGCPSSLFGSFHPSSRARPGLLRSTAQTGRDKEATSGVQLQPLIGFFTRFMTVNWIFLICGRTKTITVMLDFSQQWHFSQQNRLIKKLVDSLLQNWMFS